MCISRIRSLNSLCILHTVLLLNLACEGVQEFVSVSDLLGPLPGGSKLGFLIRCVLYREEPRIRFIHSTRNVRFPVGLQNIVYRYRCIFCGLRWMIHGSNHYYIDSKKLRKLTQPTRQKSKQLRNFIFTSRLLHGSYLYKPRPLQGTVAYWVPVPVRRPLTGGVPVQYPQA